MNATTSRRYGLLPALVVTASLALTGCSQPEDSTASTGPLPGGECPVPDGPVAVAASTRTGSAVPRVTRMVADLLHRVVVDERTLTLIDTDGTPTVRTKLALTRTSENGSSDDEITRLEQRLTTSLSVVADGGEADPLGALTLASRSVGSNGTVVLIDSGLQTTGSLRYQVGHLLLASGSDVAGHLRSAGQLPDLSGTTVVLAGLGDTADPQPRVDTAMRRRLVEQWTAIAEAAGAACVEVDDEPLTDTPAPDLPPVTAVALPKPAQPRVPDTRKTERASVPLREDTVGFRDNSAELLDPPAAVSALKPLARGIVRGDYRVSLVGTTATAGNEDGQRRLSLERARAVRRILVQLGVASGRITTRGAGIHHPKHIDDVDAQGNLIPERAVKNRAVFVTVRRS